MEAILNYVLSTYGVAFTIVIVVGYLLLPIGIKDKIKQAVSIVFRRKK